MVNGFALGAVGGDGVAGEKFTETLVQNSAIGEFDFFVGVDGFDGDEFAVGDAMGVGQFAIGFELEAFASGDGDCAGLADGYFVNHFVGDSNPFSIDFHHYAVVGDGGEAALGSGGGLADFLVEYDHGVRWVKAFVFFLRGSEVKVIQCLYGSVFFAE